MTRLFDEWWQRNQDSFKTISAKALPTSSRVMGIIFALQKQNALLASVITPRVLEASVAAGRLELSTLGGRPDIITMADPNVTKWAKSYGATQARLVNETTADMARSQIQAALAQGIQDQASTQEIGRKIRDVLVANAEPEQTLFRAARIARTEVSAAQSQGQLVAFDAVGVDLKGWLTEQDGRVRETHVEAGMQYGEGGEIPIDEDFQVGEASGPAPSHTGDPSEDINCRCVLYAAFSGSQSLISGPDETELPSP